MNEKEAAVTY